MSYFQTDTEPGNEEETEEEVGSEEQDEDGVKSAVSNPLNKFSKFSQTGANQTNGTTVMDHSVMNKAVRTFNRLKSFRPEDTEGIRSGSSHRLYGTPICE